MRIWQIYFLTFELEKHFIVIKCTRLGLQRSVNEVVRQKRLQHWSKKSLNFNASLENSLNQLYPNVEMWFMVCFFIIRVFFTFKGGGGGGRGGKNFKRVADPLNCRIGSQ